MGNCKLFIISGFSGVGKDSVIEGLEKSGFSYSQIITTTTRKMRSGESEGRPYHFVSKKKFESMIKNDDFFEWAKVYNNYYGSTKKDFYKAVSTKLPIILRIDAQGIKNIKKKILESVVIFIVPPSIKILEKRLRQRKTDSEKSIEIRLTKIKEEEKTKSLWDYQVVNKEGKLNETIKKVKKIILKKFYG